MHKTSFLAKIYDLNPRMILIHVPQITERLQYTFDFFFQTLIRIPFRLTTDKKEYLSFTGAKFIYGNENFSGGIFFSSSGLLFEREIVHHNFSFENWNGMKVFCKVAGGELPFDPFSAAFYLVSRYEEYLPGNTDRHQRFKARKSIAYKADFLKKPVVNIWANAIADIIAKNFPSVNIPERTYSMQATIAIDNAFAYRHKGFFLNGAKLLVLLLTFRFGKFWNRLKVVCRLSQDPYDTYDKQIAIHKKYRIKPFYFILLGDMGKYDRNLSHQDPVFIKLIQKLDKFSEVNLHPSYESNNSPDMLLKEKERLENILGRKVSKSRQHYLKLNFPGTYRSLIQAGIREDYSMGYPSRTGFRAGTSSPFLFFDLELNKVTELKIHPFVTMDTSLKVYQRKRADEVIEHLRPVVREVKDNGGNFCFIFHNESMGGERIWKHWGNVYENVIKLAVEEKDHVEVV